MALMNRRLYPGVETVFMMTGAEYSYLSSSIVKEIARHVLRRPVVGVVSPRPEEPVGSTPAVDAIGSLEVVGTLPIPPLEVSGVLVGVLVGLADSAPLLVVG